MQVTYGALIATFLGAIHWGGSMASVSSLDGRQAQLVRERYVWSVFPSLAAWPIVAGSMQAGPAALSASALLVRQ